MERGRRPIDPEVTPLLAVEQKMALKGSILPLSNLQNILDQAVECLLEGRPCVVSLLGHNASSKTTTANEFGKHLQLYSRPDPKALWGREGSWINAGYAAFERAQQFSRDIGVVERRPGLQLAGDYEKSNIALAYACAQVLENNGTVILESPGFAGRGSLVNEWLGGREEIFNRYPDLKRLFLICLGNKEVWDQTALEREVLDEQNGNDSSLALDKARGGGYFAMRRLKHCIDAVYRGICLDVNDLLAGGDTRFDRKFSYDHVIKKLSEGTNVFDDFDYLAEFYDACIPELYLQKRFKLTPDEIESSACITRPPKIEGLSKDRSWLDDYDVFALFKEQGLLLPEDDEAALIRTAWPTESKRFNALESFYQTLY